VRGCGLQSVLVAERARLGVITEVNEAETPPHPNPLPRQGVCRGAREAMVEKALAMIGGILVGTPPSPQPSPPLRGQGYRI